MRLTEATWTLAATCCAFDAGIMDFLDSAHTVEEVRDHTRTVPPQLVEALLDVLAAAGGVSRDGVTVRVSDASRPLVHSPFRGTVLAEMKSALLQARCLISPGQCDSGELLPWQHTDPEVLEAQGAGGALLGELISMSLVPSIPGLAAALSAPGAAFLDVGAGVARLSIAMAERWPALRVVGLEPWMPAAQLACRNVAEAGMAQRVEIRTQRVERLTDRREFELAWLPTPFIAMELLPEAVACVRAALCDGGWLFVGITGDAPDSGTGALTRLITATWGGSAVEVEQGLRLLADGGMREAEAVALPDGPTILIARKAATRANRQVEREGWMSTCARASGGSVKRARSRRRYETHEARHETSNQVGGDTSTHRS